MSEIFFFLDLFIDLICISVLPAYMYIHAPHAYGAHRGHKRASDPPELELQSVVLPCGC